MPSEDHAGLVMNVRAQIFSDAAGMDTLSCISRDMRFSSAVIRAVGGMAGTPVTWTTNPNGTQLRLALEPPHKHHTNKEIRDVPPQEVKVCSHALPF